MLRFHSSPTKRLVLLPDINALKPQSTSDTSHVGTACLLCLFSPWSVVRFVPFPNYPLFSWQRNGRSAQEPCYGWIKKLPFFPHYRSCAPIPVTTPFTVGILSSAGKTKERRNPSNLGWSLQISKLFLCLPHKQIYVLWFLPSLVIRISVLFLKTYR